MTNFIGTNNAQTTLAAAAASGDTTLSLASAANFPSSIPDGYVLPITLNDAATRSIFEIVYATAITGTSVTVMRGQEGTAAQNWSVGDIAYSASTAGYEAALANGNGQATGSVQIQAIRKNLLIVNNETTPDTEIDISADEIAVEDSSGTCMKLSAVAVTINYATSGAGGLDTGSLAASTGYNHWVIYNPTTATVKGLGSLSATAPTLPSGYTYKARVGWNHTDGTSKFYRVRQAGATASYAVTPSTNTASLPQLASGAQTQWTAVSLSGAVPPTAIKVTPILVSSSSNTNLGYVAPNSNYAVSFAPISSWVQTFNNDCSIMGTLILESSDIFVSMQANNQLYLYGWEDNI